MKASRRQLSPAALSNLYSQTAGASWRSSSPVIHRTCRSFGVCSAVPASAFRYLLPAWPPLPDSNESCWAASAGAEENATFRHSKRRLRTSSSVPCVASSSQSKRSGSLKGHSPIIAMHSKWQLNIHAAISYSSIIIRFHASNMKLGCMLASITSDVKSWHGMQIILSSEKAKVRHSCDPI